MKLYAPDYYKDFSCIADKCTHSCCVGWEIDIDSDTLDYYRSVKSEFGTRLAENIEVEDAEGHFKLSDEERCPFLNENNLCDIILELGEDKLCQICTDHPRFRNFFDTRTEIGIGMCCEEAARLILTRKDKTEILNITDDVEEEWESSFFSIRDRIFDIVKNRDLSIDERISILCSEFGVSLPDKTLDEWIDIFLGLERLEESWSLRLNAKKGINVNYVFDREWDIPFEQLLVYFIYRHLAGSIDDGRFTERLAFSLISFIIIRTLLSANPSMSEFLDITREYSAEIEYSEDNIEDLLKICSF